MVTKGGLPAFKYLRVYTTVPHNNALFYSTYHEKARKKLLPLPGMLFSLIFASLVLVTLNGTSSESLSLECSYLVSIMAPYFTSLHSVYHYLIIDVFNFFVCFLHHSPCPQLGFKFKKSKECICLVHHSVP